MTNGNTEMRRQDGLNTIGSGIGNEALIHVVV